jgi:hypothetical protein
MIVRGTMDAGINNVIYMELHLGPKMANGARGKTIIVGTIDRGSTVYCMGVGGERTEWLASQFGVGWG